ncbi:hypothetical protein G4B88_025510 [Cannabis sativa]|uniref:DUF4283 domain-containing protein n=1 Tax=Cannabis sativa TaxID=3483 RepID=A0A7J6DZW5_CANSA|nr:hypothetical protein G4B88_025510 [Cannabis sativa]
MAPVVESAYCIPSKRLLSSVASVFLLASEVFSGSDMDEKGKEIQVDFIDTEKEEVMKRDSALEMEMLELFEDITLEDVVASKACVGKVVGCKDMPASVVKKILGGVWRRLGFWRMKKCEEGVLGFFFDDEDDFHFVMEKRPWIINGVLLNLKPWPVEGEVRVGEFEVAQFWVQFHGLPTRFLSNDNVPILAKKVGNLVRMEDKRKDDLLSRRKTWKRNNNPVEASDQRAVAAMAESQTVVEKGTVGTKDKESGQKRKGVHGGTSTTSVDDLQCTGKGTTKVTDGIPLLPDLPVQSVENVGNRQLGVPLTHLFCKASCLDSRSSIGSLEVEAVAVDGVVRLGARSGPKLITPFLGTGSSSSNIGTLAHLHISVMRHGKNNFPFTRCAQSRISFAITLPTLIFLPFMMQ